MHSPDRIRALHLVVAAGALFAVVAGWISGSQDDVGFVPRTGENTVSGELIVQFGPETTHEQREAILHSVNGSIQRELSLPGYVVVDLPAGRETRAGALLAQSPAVASVDQEVLRQPAGVPDDPAYPQQWHLPIIGLEAASDLADGAGVTVAVVDTGVAFETYVNPETNDSFAPAPDLSGTSFVDPCDVTNGVPCWCETTSVACVCPAGIAPCANILRNTHANDDYGHGTHVAGTIAETTNNGAGGAGVAPQALIMPVKACAYTFRAPPPDHPEKSGYGCKPQDLADAIVYAAKQGADIINLSISSPPEPGSPKGSITQAERDALAVAEAAGVPVIGASGNDDLNNLTYPAAVPSVVAVGAVGMNKIRASYSNYGLDEDGGLMDLVAPGGDASREGTQSYVRQQSYTACTRAESFLVFPPVTPCQGTSMAAAHVSGVVALLLSRFANLSLDDVRDILQCGAEDLGNAGPDERYGAGLVRADWVLTDSDADGIADCIDPFVPTPTPFPSPFNNCLVPITQSPTPTPSPEPPPTETPVASASASPTATPDPMATPTPTPTPVGQTPSPTPGIVSECGDVDCSGSVNALDALGIMAWAATSLPIAQCIGLGYTTCDEVLDALDAAAVLSYSGGLTQTIGCSVPQ